MSWVASARWIVENNTHETLDPDTGLITAPNRGVLLDLFSASLMVQVHDALNETNRARFAAMPVAKAHAFALKLSARVS